MADWTTQLEENTMYKVRLNGEENLRSKLFRKKRGIELYFSDKLSDKEDRWIMYNKFDFTYVARATGWSSQKEPIFESLEGGSKFNRRKSKKSRKNKRRTNKRRR